MLTIPKRPLAIALAAGTLLLAGCAQTHPATNVTATSATLNGELRASANSTWSFEYWWEYSGDGGATWTATPHQTFGPVTCSSGSYCAYPVSKDITALSPSHHYVFRLAVIPQGLSSPVYGDSNSNAGGDQDPPYEYDAFDTPAAGCPSLGSFSAGNWPPACWRPFNPSSPFNQPVDHARVDPSSQAIVDWFTGQGSPGPGKWASDDCWAHPVYFARPSDPLYRVEFVDPWDSSARGTQVHIPAGAKPACPAPPDTDAHMAVIDQATGWEYDVWQVKSIANGTITAQFGGRTRSDGLGIANATDHPGSTAADFALTGGSLRASEVGAGNVNHALFLTTWCVNGTVYPANGGASQCSPSAGNPGLYLGSRLFLEMSQQQIAGLALPDWQKAILEALRKYGGYIGDTGGSGGWGIMHEGAETYTSFPPNQDAWFTLGRQVFGPDPQWEGHYIFDMRDSIDWRRYLRVAAP
jgi:hypothetical protein